MDVISEIKTIRREEIGNNADDDVQQDPEIRLSGEAIGKVLLKKVQVLGLDLEKCVAQGYDGASTMSSERVGVSAVFKERAELAYYFHCAMHYLNLVASQAIKVPGIRHAEDVVHEISKLFRPSTKRSDVLKTLIEQADDTRVSKRHLTTLCQTRFIERHTAVVTLRQLLPFVLDALESMKEWTSAETRRSAHTLLNSILQSDFIVGLIILENLSGILLPLTHALQTVGVEWI